MRRRIFAALAASVALPMLATSASAQQGHDYGYSPSAAAAYHWSESRNAIERDRRRRMEAFAGRDAAPVPPRTPGRYVSDGDQAGQGRDRPDPPYTPDRYVTDWDRGGGYGTRPYADERWTGRNPPMRDFDRPDPPPGYSDHHGYGGDMSMRDAHDGRGSHERGYRDERGFDPYAGHRWGHMDDRERHHREVMTRHHDAGYQDRDFRHDFAQDGRQRMGGRHERMGDVDMRQMRRAMRMIDRFDVDDDGRVTQREVDRYRSDRLRQFDADSDEQLTLEEYAALWADAMRERMVRRFQRHDRDGDARVTLDEFSAATRDLVRMRDRNRDQAISEEDFMRPEVAAPLSGTPNDPAESRVPGDDDVADHETRPKVEAPVEGTPNEPAGSAATENGDAGADEDTLETTTN